MRKYRIRLVAVSGPDPITGELLDGAEEVVEVEADSIEHARRRAPYAMSMRLSGQLLRFYDEATGEEITSEHEPRPARRGTFAIDGIPGAYSGITRGESWNGWAVPYFEKETSERIAEDYACAAKEHGGDMAGASARYDAEMDAFLFYDPIYRDEVAYPSTKIEVDDGEVTVYPIGTREWTWEEARGAGTPTESPQAL